MQITRVEGGRCKVGEGPVWDERRQHLYFVDLIGQQLLRLEPAGGSVERWELPQIIAAVALTEEGGVVVALQDGFYMLDLVTSSLHSVAREQIVAGTQFNDGKVDRQGRFVAVSMHRAMKEPVAGIFRLIGDHIETLDSGYVIGNGPCWSLDAKTLYCADSVAKVIYAYDYPADASPLSNRRIFADTSAIGGIPDGATIDSEDCMWMAMCGAGKVVRFSATGAVTRVIDMPTPWVSSVMFGGPNMDRIYVTSLDPTLLGLPPDAAAGHLYVIEGLDTRGVVEPRLALSTAGIHQGVAHEA